MPDEIDRDLLERFVHGEPDAFEALFRRFQPAAYRWILRIVADAAAAEDAVVETFWRAHRGRARFDPSRPFGAWLRRIATNVSLDHLKAVRRSTAWPSARDDLPAPAGPDRELRLALQRAFRRLGPRLQVVARLALIEQQPYEEIADALDLPIGTVKSRVFRATRALRKELAREGYQQ